MQNASKSKKNGDDEGRFLDPRELPSVMAPATLALALSAAAFVLIAKFGDSPRPVVNRLNGFLAPFVAVALGLAIRAAWNYSRARSACRRLPRR